MMPSLLSHPHSLAAGDLQVINVWHMQNWALKINLAKQNPNVLDCLLRVMIGLP